MIHVLIVVVIAPRVPEGNTICSDELVGGARGRHSIALVRWRVIVSDARADAAVARRQVAPGGCHIILVEVVATVKA